MTEKIIREPAPEETIFTTALAYLNWHGQWQDLTSAQRNAMENGLENVRKFADFRVRTARYTLKNQTLEELSLFLPGEDLRHYLDGCEQVLLIASTLGLRLEQRLRRLHYLDMAAAVLEDALASALLEFQTDDYQQRLHLGPHTARLAPGYGDIPLALNLPFSQALAIESIGMSLSGNYLFIPQKSMLGLIGIGQELQKKSCGHCIRKAECSLRRSGLRCYQP